MIDLEIGERLAARDGSTPRVLGRTSQPPAEPGGIGKVGGKEPIQTGGKPLPAEQPVPVGAGGRGSEIKATENIPPPKPKPTPPPPEPPEIPATIGGTPTGQHLPASKISPKTLTDQEALSQALKTRNAKVTAGELKGAAPGPTGTPGHAMGKHGVTNETAADIINNAERKFVGINENGRAVNVFVKDGNVVITEGNDVTRVITAYGKDTVTKVQGGKVKPGKGVDPDQWANNPSYNEVK